MFCNVTESTTSYISDNPTEVCNDSNVTLAQVSTSKKENTPCVFNNCNVTINNYYGNIEQH